MGKKAPGWSDVKRVVSGMPRPELLSLIKELFDLSAENRNFLVARFASGPGNRNIEPYRTRVVHPFFPKGGGDGDLDMRDARAAIREYEKATSDLKGTLDLMLTFVESGNEFTRTYGDIDARFYENLESMLDRFAKRLISPEGRPLYPDFTERLKDLENGSRDIGWGYSDTIGDILYEIEEAFAHEGEQGKYGAA